MKFPLHAMLLFLNRTKTNKKKKTKKTHTHTHAPPRRLAVGFELAVVRKRMKKRRDKREKEGERKTTSVRVCLRKKKKSDVREKQNNILTGLVEKRILRCWRTKQAMSAPRKEGRKGVRTKNTAKQEA